MRSFSNTRTHRDFRRIQSDEQLQASEIIDYGQDMIVTIDGEQGKGSSEDAHPTAISAPLSPDAERLPRPLRVSGLLSHSDDALLRLCSTGDEEALAELVRRYQHSIYRFLTRYLEVGEDAEQATLNVFVKAWRNAATFQFRASVSTWLFRIAINIAQDMHKRRRKQPSQHPWPHDYLLSGDAIGNAQEEALRLLESQDRSIELRRALGMLKEDDRLVLVLYYLEERSYEEIQAMTALSNTVLKMRLTRARKRLRQALDTLQRSNG